MKFTKMQGCGNDYIYIDTFAAKNQVQDRSRLARLLSNRNFAIGSDGLIFINPSQEADFEMEMYNLDGSRAQMCGNGIRCLGKYVFEHGLTQKTSFSVQTLAGIKQLSLKLEGNEVKSVSVEMGEARFSAEDLNLNPAAFEHFTAGGPSLLRVLESSYEVFCVSMGNPHCVIFTELPVETLDLPKLGAAFENHPGFEKKVNAEFVNLISPGQIRVRVWERGSGETCACGTGACACVVAGILKGVLDHDVTVTMKGGPLGVHWDQTSNRVTLSGPAVTVFCGETKTIEEPYDFARTSC